MVGIKKPQQINKDIEHLIEREPALEKFLDERDKRKRDSKRNWAIIISLVVCAIILITASFLGREGITGFIIYHEGRGGYIYNMNLIYTRPTYNWVALYGAAFGVGFSQPWEYTFEPGGTEEANMFFDCVEEGKDNLLFASTVPPEEIVVQDLVPMSPAEVNAFINSNPDDYDSASNTFTGTMSIEIGSKTINNIPAATTKVGSGTEEGTFKTGLLKDSNGNPVVVTILNERLVKGFTNRYYNYQFLLPVHNNQTTKYYVFIDPTNVCISGQEEPYVKGIVYGIVTDISGNPLENVLITSGPKSTVTDEKGFYNLTTRAGETQIIAIKENYQVYESNITIPEGNSTMHNIIMELEVEQKEYDSPPAEQNVGPDFGPNVGPGEIPYRKERPSEIEGKEFWISVNKIYKKIRLAEFAQEVIHIQSFKNKGIQLQFNITGDVKKITMMDKRGTFIGAKDLDDLTLTFFGNSTPGVYNGTLNITGGINTTIPIIIEILGKEKSPVQAMLMEISVPEKNYYPGSFVRFKNSLTNLLTDQQYPVQLVYTIQNINGNETLWTHQTNVFLRTSLSIIKNYELPPDLPTGEYIIRASASYLDLTSSTSAVFTVTEPFYQHLLFGKIRVWQAILMGIGLALLIFGIFMLRKEIEAKKKYHLKVEYSQLPKPGPDTIYVGKIAETNNRTYFKIENFKTHTIVAGSTGGGKSFAAQVIIEELLDKDVAVIVFDPTAQWTGFLRKLENKGLLNLYSGFGMKPNDAKAFKGNIREITDAKEIINIKKYMKPGEIQVFALHKLDPKDIDVFVANTVREVFHEGFDESQELRLCLVYDEVHRLLSKFGGSGEGFIQIERACREFRKWGIGVMLISQVLADFVGQIKANINTEIQMRTRDEGDLERIKTKYGDEVLKSLVKASVGTGMVQNSAYNRGRPYFVTFKPIKHSVERLSDEEIEKYNEYNDIIDQMQFELEQLEQLDQDVFDLKLELKLALDKVKAGGFNMAKIYLDGLKPRVEKLWKKLGKKPKKLERPKVSEEEMRRELEKAKKEREKIEAEQKKGDEEGKKKEGESEKSVTERFNRDVKPENMLKLNNGMLVVNPRDLYAEIEAMKDSDFKFHVNDEKNDFADWIRNAVGDDELADLLDETKDRKEILELLDKRSKGEKLPKKEKGKDDKKKNESKEDDGKDGEDGKGEENGEDRKEGKDDEESDTVSEEKGDEGENNENREDRKEEKDGGKEKGEEDRENKEEGKEREEKEGKSNNKEAGEEGEGNVDETTKEKNKDDTLESPESKNNLEGLLNKKAPKGKEFRFSDGKVASNLKELKEILKDMPDETFRKYVNEEKHDFSNWIKYSLEDEEFAERIGNLMKKDKLVEALSNGPGNE